MNLARALSQTALRLPHHPAVTWGERTQTWAELDQRSDALAKALRGAGMRTGDRIAVVMQNRPELLETMYAAFKAGLVFVPLNSKLSPSEIDYHLADSGAAALISDREVPDAPATVLVTGPHYEAVLSANLGCAPELTDVAPDAAAWLFYTSGTTGRPKGAVLSHGALSFVIASWLADLTPMDQHDVTLHAAPLSHGAGFHALAATARGAHQVIAAWERFSPAAALELMREHAVTNTWLVPTQITMLTDHLDGADPKLPALQYVVYGGAPFPRPELAAALRCFGPILVQLYGQGEAPMTITWLPPTEHHDRLLGSAGRPRPGMDVRIVDPESGAPVVPGVVGEVTVSGPALMTGYWQRPEESAKALRHNWLHTGDLGTIDECGYLFLLDRAKDLIITGGSNVYAVEVERILLEHHAVADAAVIGVPDRTWGETVRAVVVSSATADDLQAHCREWLAGYKTPRSFEFVDEIPRNAYGKINKVALRQRLTMDGQMR